MGPGIPLQQPKQAQGENHERKKTPHTSTHNENNQNSNRNTHHGLIVLITTPLVQKGIENQKKLLNISFEYEEYEVRVLQTDSADSQPQIIIEDKNGFISAKTEYQKNRNTPWTEPFEVLDRTYCDPSSPLYKYTWEDFEELRETARQFKEAEIP
jgi:hypothetical protein